jgi:small subunit ribosomal protein S4
VAGDVIAIRERAREQLRIKNALAIAAQAGFPEWVEVDEQAMTGTLKSLPARDDILPDINENLVVELYSK